MRPLRLERPTIRLRWLRLDHFGRIVGGGRRAIGSVRVRWLDLDHLGRTVGGELDEVGAP